MYSRVFVQHEPRHNGNGDVTGVVFRKHGHVIQDVHQQYLHRDAHGFKVIKTSSGDTWSVRPVNHKDYQFVTV